MRHHPHSQPSGSNPEMRLKQLSPGRKALVEVMQRTGHGHIEKLRIRAGEPVFHPLPVITRLVRFGAKPRAAPPETGTDFALKGHLMDFFKELDELGDGEIRHLDIQDGLPISMSIQEEPRSS